MNDEEPTIERLVIEYYMDHFSDILEESGYGELFRESYMMIEPFMGNLDITDVDRDELENTTAEDIYNTMPKAVKPLIKVMRVEKDFILNLIDFGLTMGKISIDVVAQLKQDYEDTELDREVIGELYFTTLAEKVPKEEYLRQVDSIATAIETYIPPICNNKGIKGRMMGGVRAGLKKYIMSQEDVPEDAGALFDKFVKDVQDNPGKIKRLADTLREKEAEYIGRFYG